MSLGQFCLPPLKAFSTSSSSIAMPVGSSECMCTSPPPSSTIFGICRSMELDWSDGDDSDGSAVEDEESVEDEHGAGHIPSGGELEPWRPVSPARRLKRRINSWRKLRMLGKGSFGDVYEVITDDGSFFAVKEISLSEHTNHSVVQLEQEISLLSQLEHANIVQYIGTDKDNEKLYVFRELMPRGSLSNYYCKYGLIESQVSSYTRQLLNVLKYLHDKKVMHRDSKCANILVGTNGIVKLSDFGLTKATKKNPANSFKGTLLWMAPEVFENEEGRSYGSSADIWSLGCTVLEMSTCKPPYSECALDKALSKIRGKKPPRVPKSLSEDVQDFICRCLQVIPEDRPSAVELLEHPFVREPPTSDFAWPSHKSILL